MHGWMDGCYGKGPFFLWGYVRPLDVISMWKNLQIERGYEDNGLLGGLYER